ncbi:hypothetical protein [Halobacterium rubrum]|uniref:hypothetical protein n=1 Tax=Halobacterium TaxID=2239 RepID=UPI001F2DD0B3|nr:MULTISPECIES: hypothetical protein [Halobacterium]MDH5019485.1 hypothetical protein [Halobacterium rubrum]
MSRQIRITVDDDEVFERLKRRKDALDLSWEDALRRGLRDSKQPPRAPDAGDARPEPDPGRDRGGRRSTDARREAASGSDPSPFDPDFGERLAERVLSTVGESVSGVADSLDEEIDRLEDAEDAVLVLGDGDGERVPLRVSLHTGPGGLDVDVVAVRSGKDTEGMNEFADGARATVARRFARGETATLELAGGEETYDVRPELEWARGDDGTPSVTDVSVRDVVFEE